MLQLWHVKFEIYKCVCYKILNKMMSLYILYARRLKEHDLSRFTIVYRFIAQRILVATSDTIGQVRITSCL